MSQPTKKSPKLVIAVCVVSVLLIAGFVLFTRSMLASKDQKTQRMVQTVQIIRPPPPPPPPPDQPPPPPPPPKPEEQIPQNEPDPSPDPSPSPVEQLGLDAEGSAGGDAFGLAAHQGGSSLVGTGGAAFAWYTGKIKDLMLERLSGDARLRSKKFSVGVRVWVAPDGTIKEAKLSSTTGDKELDRAITDILSRSQRLGESPPLEMPQPISIRIVSQI